MKTLYGWGRYPKIKANIVYPNSIEELTRIIKNKPGSLIARGNGRSYGDASINKNLTVSTLKLNKFINLDNKKGELIIQAGVLFADIIDICLPKGWFPYVTPGTKFITVGGAIASDIHGKNHHLEGSFGNFVNWFEIIDINGKLQRCSNLENKNLFDLTIGGMGLTGIITKCSINLRKVQSGWIKQKIVINKNLNETINSFESFNDSLYSVAWIDCLSSGKNLGRSVLMLGEHALNEDLVSDQELFPKQKKQILSLLFNLPSFVLNNITVKIFNKFYYFISSLKSIKNTTDWDSYFYPLDSIKNWNRLYGKKGFFQFQCILPIDKSFQGYSDILKVIQNNSSGAFLAVLKKFGKGNAFLSFPEEGFTLALDFKINKKNLSMVKLLENIVIKNGGKFYLSKDATLSSKTFKDSSVDIENFLNLVQKKSKGIEFSSELSKRLEI